MKPQSSRVLSLDVFRGMTVAFMIIVNNQWGKAFAPLRHASWDGCTPTDLVFPFFLFIVGVSMWFSYRKQNHELNPGTVWRLLKRGALIFLVGLLLNWFPFYDFGAGEWKSIWDLRIPGVLQRIGLAFFLGGVLALWLKTYKRIFIASGIILVGYWLLVKLLGDATQEGFIGNKIDGFIFGVNHLYKPALSFDPEGLFSTIPALATVLLGYATGKFVGENREDKWKTLGTLGVAGGLLISAALLFKGVCPINKGIWSSTFVLYTAGFAMQVWMLLLWFYDYRGKTAGKTLWCTFGTNALFAYVLGWVISGISLMPFMLVSWEGTKTNVMSWMARWFGSWTTPETGTLMSALVLVGFVFALVYPLYRKKIFIRL